MRPTLLAAQAPWWEPGTASGYHAITQGYLVGEVVRRVTGESVGTFFAKEVAGPLGADFHIGLRPSTTTASRTVIPPPPLPLEGVDPTSIPIRTLSNPPLSAEQSWDAGVAPRRDPGRRRSRQRPLGRRGADRAGVRRRGRRRTASCRRRGARPSSSSRRSGTDLVLGVPLRFGMGYGLDRRGDAAQPEPTRRASGAAGAVRSSSIDLDARMVVSYVMNRMGEGTLGDDRGAGIVMAAFASLAA